MSNIMEEEQIKEDSCHHHLSPVKGQRTKTGATSACLKVEMLCLKYADQGQH